MGCSEAKSVLTVPLTCCKVSAGSLACTLHASRRVCTWQWRKRGEDEPRGSKLATKGLEYAGPSWNLQYLGVHCSAYLGTSYMQ